MGHCTWRTSSTPTPISSLSQHRRYTRDSWTNRSFEYREYHGFSLIHLVETISRILFWGQRSRNLYSSKLREKCVSSKWSRNFLAKAPMSLYLQGQPPGNGTFDDLLKYCWSQQECWGCLGKGPCSWCPTVSISLALVGTPLPLVRPLTAPRHQPAFPTRLQSNFSLL